MVDLYRFHVEGRGFVKMEGIDGFEVTFQHMEGVCGNMQSLSQVMEKGVQGHLFDIKRYFQTTPGTFFSEAMVGSLMLELSIKTHPLQGVQANVARGT